MVRVEGMQLLSEIKGMNSNWINRTSQISQWTTPFFALQAEVILRLLVLKLDAHLEAAAEKSCSVFSERTNYPDRVSVSACARTLPHTCPEADL